MKLLMGHRITTFSRPRAVDNVVQLAKIASSTLERHWLDSEQRYPPSRPIEDSFTEFAHVAILYLNILPFTNLRQWLLIIMKIDLFT